MTLSTVLALLALLVIANGLLAMAETAVLSLRKGPLRKAEKQGLRGANQALSLSENPTRFLVLVQFWLTLSGTIAGVLGAYLVLYPRAPVTVFVFIFFISLPAWMVIGEWFAINLLGGVHALGLGSSGGVAFFAHIGGFLAGVLGVRPAMVGRARVPGTIFTGFRQVPRSRFGLPPGSGGSGLPGPGPGRWDSWR